MNPEEEWRRKGATLSDKTARKEYGLTQMRSRGHRRWSTPIPGELSIHGNPWFRLLRHEVEALMISTYNDSHHKQRRAKAELARVNKELKQLRAQVASLEEQRSKLLADLGE